MIEGFLSLFRSKPPPVEGEWRTVPVWSITYECGLIIHWMDAQETASGSKQRFLVEYENGFAPVFNQKTAVTFRRKTWAALRRKPLKLANEEKRVMTETRVYFPAQDVRFWEFIYANYIFLSSVFHPIHYEERLHDWSFRLELPDEN